MPTCRKSVFIIRSQFTHQASRPISGLIDLAARLGYLVNLRTFVRHHGAVWSVCALEIACLPFQLALTIYNCIIHIVRDNYYMRNDCVIDGVIA